MAQKLRFFFRFLHCRIFHKYEEFITADPANNIVHTELVSNLLGRIHNYRITKCMSEIVIDSLKIININKKQNTRLIWVFSYIMRNFFLHLKFIQKLCQRISAHFFLQRLVHINIKTASYNANDFSLRIGHTFIKSAEPLITWCLSVFADVKPGIHTI